MRAFGLATLTGDNFSRRFLTKIVCGLCAISIKKRPRIGSVECHPTNGIVATPTSNLAPQQSNIGMKNSTPMAVNWRARQLKKPAEKSRYGVETEEKISNAR
jgi:hypothetical protein